MGAGTHRKEGTERGERGEGEEGIQRGERIERGGGGRDTKRGERLMSGIVIDLHVYINFEVVVVNETCFL